MDIDLNAALAKHDMDDIVMIVGRQRIPLTHWLCATYAGIGHVVLRRDAEAMIEWCDEADPTWTGYDTPSA